VRAFQAVAQDQRLGDALERLQFDIDAAGDEDFQAALRAADRLQKGADIGIAEAAVIEQRFEIIQEQQGRRVGQGVEEQAGSDRRIGAGVVQ